MRSLLTMPPWVLATILLAGCAGSGTNVGQEALNSALQRADEHQVAAARATDPSSLRQETQAYARDMHGLLGDMTGACAGMMASMHAGASMNMAALTQSADEASTAVDQHSARMMQLTDLPAMRRECSTQKQVMDDLLGSMRSTMSQGGMMGGGMMGGGMM